MLSQKLLDPKLGGLQRYLPFTEDISTHIHAGNGPWMQYTAMLAQYYFRGGNTKKGDGLLHLIDNYKTEEGYIPEHLTTRKRFDEFMRLEWNTGLDFKKEFGEETLLPGLPFDRIVEELDVMKNSYERLRDSGSTDENEVIHFACPLMWSHVEYAMALLEKG